MDDIKEFNLPSGAVLGVTLAPFADSLELAQAVAVELERIEFSENVDHLAFIKNLACRGIASKEIEKHVRKCAARCTYNGTRISSDTWEASSARGDYLIAMARIMEENVAPFLSGLLPDFAAAKALVLTMMNTRESKSKTMHSSTT